ncbi:hypothetical protein P0F65_10100 [Sphingomonas sp. I4]
MELLRSRTLAGLVVDRLGLTEDARFDDLMRTPSVLAPILDRVPMLAATPKPVPMAARRDAAIERLVQGIDVHRTAQTFALSLSFEHHDRQLATAIVNSYAQSFVGQSGSVKREGSEAAAALLRSRLDGARREVEAADSALGRYKVANNLMSVQGGTIAEQQLSSLDGQVALARAGEAEATARLQTARQQLARGSQGTISARRWARPSSSNCAASAPSSAPRSPIWMANTARNIRRSPPRSDRWPISIRRSRARSSAPSPTSKPSAKWRRGAPGRSRVAPGRARRW